MCFSHSLWAWNGDTDKFSFCADTIHLDAPSESSQACLFDTCSAFYNALWHATFKFDYAPSSSNYCKWYIVSDSADFCDNLSGYFIRVGYSGKNIALCQQNGLKSEVLAYGEENRVVAEEPISITVERSENGDWHVWSRMESENDSLLEIKYNSSALTVNRYSGFYFKYSTTRSRSFYVWGCFHSGKTFDFKNHDTQSVWAEPLTFTPDGDAVDDIVYICYCLGTQSVVNVNIYSVSGTLVKCVAKDELVEEKGFFTWDGRSERGLIMSPGIYVAVLESSVDERLVCKKKVPFVIGVK